MKNLYHHKHKGKVHPSPSPSPPPPPSSSSILAVLPAVILTLVSILSADEQEVLAYLLTRSITTEDKKKCKKTTPIFDCGCFECYTSFWIRWDSSPNRELIHHAIEAFEDEICSKKHTKAKSKKKDKSSPPPPPVRQVKNPIPVPVPVISEGGAIEVSSPPPPPPPPPIVSEAEAVTTDLTEPSVVNGNVSQEPEAESERKPNDAVLRSPVSNHKGMARKFLPDVLGLFNSRMWSLWGPDI